MGRNVGSEAMTDLDVSLRLRLLNQLSRPAEEAERDLKELQKAAERLGKTKGGAELGKDMDRLGDKASQAKGKIGEVERETDKLRAALGRVDNGSFDGLKSDANAAKAAISSIGEEAKDLRRVLGTVDDNAFQGLKSDAAAAEQAIRQIGAAADVTDQKLRGMRTGQPGRGRHPAYGNTAPGKQGGLFSDAMSSAYDRLGFDAMVPLGAGLGYAMGGAGAGGAVVVGAALNAAANDEERSSYLQVMGGYDKDQRRRYDEIMGRVGAQHGIGMSGAQGIFGALQAGGLSHEEAIAMTNSAAVFAKATEASGEDAANTAVALRDNMGIKPDQLMQAYDAIALGGTKGKFEVNDFARNLPSMLAVSGARGSSGMEGVKLMVAIGQSVRKRKGSSDEAATSIEAMLNDLNSSSTVEGAKKYGINLDKVSAKARKEGKDPVLEQLRALRAKFGSDPAKARKVLTNQTANEGYTAVFEDFDIILEMMNEMDEAKGTVDKAYEGGTDNFNAQKERLVANLGKSVKDTASPALPALTRGMAAVSERLEASREREDRDREMVSGYFEDMRIQAYQRRTIDAYQQYGQTRAEGERGAPSRLKRFLFGAGADPSFDAKEHFGINLRPTAEQSMSGYNEGLSQEGAKAEGIAQGIAESIKAMLGFTVSPTIAPTYVPAGTATGGTVEKHSSVQQSTGVKVTQHITSPNSKHAAARAVKEQNRAIRQAQARSYAGTGRSLA